MKRSVLVFTFLISILQWKAMAQYGEKSFFKMGKEWVVEFKYDWATPTLEKFKVTGEFVLGGTKYWLIDANNDTSQPLCGWQTDTGKIFTHVRELELFHNIEMDMGLEVGDVGGYRQDGKAEPDTPDRKLIETPFFKVIKKDTIEVRGVKRARIQVENLSNPAYRVIEGTG